MLNYLTAKLISMAKQQSLERLFDTLSQLRKLVENQAQELHEERTATVMQFSALKFLKNNQNSTVGQVAEYLKLSKSSATQLIERLVKASLAKRIDDQQDRRIVHLSITSLGEEEIINLKKKFIDKMSKILSKIPDSDLRQLIRIHTNLIETLQKEQK